MNVEMARGVLLCAVGSQKYYDLCNNLIKDIRLVMPGIRIAVYTDNSKKIKDFDELISGTHDPENLFRSKIKACQSTPFLKTLFIDVDCRLLMPVGHLFDILETHQIAFGFTDGRPGFWKDDKDGQYNQYLFSSSTLLFRKDEIVIDLFYRWEKEYLNQLLVPAPGDQMYLSFLVFNDQRVRYTVLPVEYRFNCDLPQIVKGKVKIITSLIIDYGLNFSVKRLNEIINSYEGERVIFFNLLGTYKWRSKSIKLSNRITIKLISKSDSIVGKWYRRLFR